MLVDFENLFLLCGNLAMLGWLALIAFPWRWKLLLLLTGTIIPALFGVLYAGLILAYFADVDGGGFGSLDQVRALFADDAALLAGWLHYLAFDLAIGTMIARRADEAGLSRLVQVPMLLFTFLFGPLGFVMFVLTDAGWRLIRGPQKLEVA